jgi:CheY-like chemotaxis protein
VIDDILDLSKIEAGKMTLELLPCSPMQIIEDVLSLMRVRADTRGLPLILEYAGPIPETIHTDPLRLRQILINVLANAIKFTELGEVRLIVSFQAGDGGNLMQFDAIDTGIGMTPDQASRLFQPFVQADTSTSRQYGGTGLGLAISMRLVRMLGGTITIVKTQPGRGTHCRVTVDAGPMDGARMIDNPLAAERQDAGPAAAASLPSLTGCTILLAEDGPDNARLISHILTKIGAEVTVVENGRLAVDRALEAAARGRPFDVILMDIQMPLMDGYEATRLLRRQGYSGRIIALTAHAMSGDRRKCLDAGCDNYAVKPIDRKILIETIQSELLAAATQ